MKLGERIEGAAEWVLLTLLLAGLGFNVLATGGVRLVDLALAQVLLGLAIALWVAYLWIGRSNRLFVASACWGVLLFMVYAAVWYPWADIEYVARREVTYVAFLVAAFWIASLSLRNADCTRWFVHLLAVLAVLVAGYGIYQFATGSERVWTFIRPAQYAGRGSGTFICPNHFAAFLGMVFPLALSRAFFGRCHVATRLLLGYAAVVMLGGLALSLSRGAWIAGAVTLVFLLFYLVRMSKGRWLAVGLLVVVCAGSYWFALRVPQVTERLSIERSTNAPHEMRTRLWIWQSGWAMWREQPWLGVGPGHFDHRFPKHRVRLAHHRPGRAHNDYLNVLVDWGVLGAAIMTVTLGILAWHGLKGWELARREGARTGSNQSDRAAFLLGATGGLLFAAIHSVVEFNLYVPGTAGMAAALAGGLAAHSRYTAGGRWLPLRWPGRVVVSGLAISVVLLLTVQSGRMHAEGQWLDRARALPNQPQQRLEVLMEAYAVEPGNPDTLYEIGECHRLMSWQGTAGWEAAAMEAMQWYRRADRINPYSPYPALHIGMCLDWLGHHELAGAWFAEAFSRDPLNYRVNALYGWHAFQRGDLAEAQSWFERSLAIKVWPNPIAERYLRIVRRTLAERPAAQE
jgi:O-antigen ligase